MPYKGAVNMNLDLEKFKYNFNLLSTETTNDAKDLCRTNKLEIDYSSSIKFIDLITKFNTLYVAFKKEYEKIEKLNLSKSMDFVSFYQTKNFRQLRLDLYDVKDGIYNEDGWIYLLLNEENGVLENYIANTIYIPLDEDRVFEKINIDSNIAKKHLELIEKYQELFEAYNTFKNAFVCGNGVSLLFTKINSPLFDENPEFELSFGNLYFNGEDFIKVTFELGKHIKIKNQSIKIDNQYINDKDKIKESVTYFLENLYVNTNKLPNLYNKTLKKNI